MVLHYSDGLVEQPSQPLDVGMERLRAAVAAHRSESVSTILDRLIRELPDPNHADDTYALVAGLPPQGD